MKLVSLPQGLVVAVLSQLGPKDIGKAAAVSRKLEAAANDESLWETLARRYYGSRVARSTRSMYGSYKDMVRDDNRRGALPTLHGLWKSPCHNNSPTSFYCCLVVCIKWHRPSNMLWLYLDARGESDLRHPGTSALWFRELGTNKNVPLLGARNAFAGTPSNVQQYDFVPDPNAVGRNDRFKGVLQIDASLFSRAGSYEFCYANAILHRDYQECSLFTVDREQDLMDVFTSFSLENESPFASETEAAWNERWRPHLTLAVEAPANRLGPWPERIGMTGDEAASYIRSQNPDLKVSAIPPDVSVKRDHRSGRVRFRVDHRGIVERAPKRG
ncbi:expressed unknown protein [Seminavis robusta]|uniref:F-box domain-containing protein n=1 Tax=Seminavis robusta TaxID=568900 RepID=A0A9N8H2R3_9STRA|nr:expressed unknown protein [Seminavis robusta]|eukprot:Sro42_g025530.1 n/a (329) ;mRNA; f:45327-46313